MFPTFSRALVLLSVAYVASLATADNTTANTTVSTVDPSPTDSTDSSSDSAALTQWENFSVAFIVIVGSITALLINIGVVYDACKFENAIDTIDFIAVVRFGGNFCDFGTDVIFTLVLLEQKSSLALYSALFTFIPYAFSIGVGIYWVERWRSRRNAHLLPYLKKYDIFVYVGIVLTGFYSTVSLIRSKLFALGMFNFQLRRKDVQRLQDWRFVNAVFLEV